jgi:hypothetical protein
MVLGWEGMWCLDEVVRASVGCVAMYSNGRRCWRVYRVMVGSEGGVWWRRSVHVLFGDGSVAKRFFPFFVLLCFLWAGQDGSHDFGGGGGGG